MGHLLLSVCNNVCWYYTVIPLLLLLLVGVIISWTPIESRTVHDPQDICIYFDLMDSIPVVYY
jgi:hypothetical protein